MTDLVEKTIGAVLAAAASAGQHLDGCVGQATGGERSFRLSNSAGDNLRTF